MSTTNTMSKFALALGASSILCTGVAHAAVINQGDQYISDTNAACTVGYVDKSTNSFWTAAHCVGDNGSKVYDKSGETLGVVTSRDMGSRYDAKRDTATITISKGNTAGDNIYSGDKIANVKDIRPGDTLKSQGSKSGVYQGTVNKTDGNSTISNRGMHPNKGDSGGASWVEGKGFVGITSGQYPDGSGVWTMPSNAKQPPAQTPPVNTPPVQTPPVDIPPVQIPPVDIPPVDTPPVQIPQPIPVNNQVNKQLHTTIDQTAQTAHQVTSDVAAGINNANTQWNNANPQLGTNAIDVAGIVGGYEAATHQNIDNAAFFAHGVVDTWIPAQ